MKIAIPTKENMVDDHFGHCEYYTVLTIGQDNQILSSEMIPSPQGCGCKSDIAGVLENMGVSVMLAGNMGQGALNVLTSHHIKVIRLLREHPECRNRLSEWENHGFRYRLFIA